MSAKGPALQKPSYSTKLIFAWDFQGSFLGGECKVASSVITSFDYTSSLVPTSTDWDIPQQIWKIATSPKQENFRLDKCDIRVSTNSCDAAWKWEAAKKKI